MKRRSVWMAAGALVLPVFGFAQGSIFGTNLIVNGDAEGGSGGNGTTAVASVPGWTKTGGADVYAYATAYKNLNALSANDIVPQNHGNNYFAGGKAATNSSLTQSISLSS